MPRIFEDLRTHTNIWHILIYTDVLLFLHLMFFFNYIEFIYRCSICYLFITIYTSILGLHRDIVVPYRIPWEKNIFLLLYTFRRGQSTLAQNFWITIDRVIIKKEEIFKGNNISRPIFFFKTVDFQVHFSKVILSLSEKHVSLLIKYAVEFNFR